MKAYKRPDGGISIVYHTNESINKENINNEYILIGEDIELPSREFRDAWTINSSKIDIDFNKAKEITKNRIRIEREKELKKLDVEYMRALEMNVDTASIINRKQKLRDITKRIDECTTLDELRYINCD